MSSSSVEVCMHEEPAAVEFSIHHCPFQVSFDVRPGNSADEMHDKSMSICIPALVRF